MYPNQPGRVYLCPQFWKAKNTGSDTKFGGELVPFTSTVTRSKITVVTVIVHEQSHFTNNGGTEDKAYGQQGCKELAQASPEDATHNADNYEYFTEAVLEGR